MAHIQNEIFIETDIKYYMFLQGLYETKQPYNIICFYKVSALCIQLKLTDALNSFKTCEMYMQ